MTEFSYTVHDDNGIHARPAGLLVSQAQKHPCSIRMFCGERQADCKRLFQVMRLNVKQGETVRICCEGDAEAEAAQALEALGADAVIVSDLGAIATIRKDCPHCPFT